MTKSQTITFLTDLGIDKATATKMASAIPDTATETPNDEIESALQSAVEHQKSLFTNSDDYKTTLKSVKDRAIAEAHTKAEKKIAQIAGLSSDDIKDKKFDEIADMAWKKAAKMGDATTEQVQAELVKKDDELKKLQEQIPLIRAEVDSKITEFKTESLLMKQISGLKLRKGLSTDDMIILAKTKANNLGYKMTISDKGDIEFTNSDGSKIMTADKKQFIGATDLLSNMLEGMIEKSNADDVDDPNKKRTIVIDDKDKDKTTNVGGTALNAAVEKAKENARILKEKASQGS